MERQIDALSTAGVAPERIFVDMKSGAHTNRPGLAALLEYARDGDVSSCTLDRLGRTVLDILNLIHDLTERGVGLRNLAGPITVDSTDSTDPMGQLVPVLTGLPGSGLRPALAACTSRRIPTSAGTRRSPA